MVKRANEKEMKISIIHPSRQRPEQAATTAKKWLSSAKDRDVIEYFISIDSDDNFQDKYHELLKDVIQVRFFKSYNKSAIEAINKAAKHTIHDIIIVVSDDFSTPPFHWDEYLLKALEGKSDYLVKTQDGIQKTLVTLPIMDRMYYERFGYIYHHDYIHMSSDVELTSVAHMLGKIIELPITIPHNHYSTGRTNVNAAKMDAVNVKADQSYNQGAQVFQRRLGKMFDLNPNDIVKHYKDIIWH